MSYTPHTAWYLPQISIPPDVLLSCGMHTYPSWIMSMTHPYEYWKYKIIDNRSSVTFNFSEMIVIHHICLCSLYHILLISVSYIYIIRFLISLSAENGRMWMAEIIFKLQGRIISILSAEWRVLKDKVNCNWDTTLKGLLQC